ncbi:hypothetical protein [Arthrobacter sp. 2MCAF14]|uniref:hypothetical protein n=1 Tax=Arthrobacter sp. 2MCAF14 TaxID=3232982 RepID=UPI003F8EEE6A
MAVALADVAAGEIIELDSTTTHITGPIPARHKFTTSALNGHAAVIKQVETIGHATQAIRPGAHVHIHNVSSASLPEERDDTLHGYPRSPASEWRNQ